ncbi:MAG TPA: TetR/AcrR family transcriptional regulator [Acidimicrobiales bacterium]|nr:TetR/AcrR family transcriptional regulator [Acidimicrobiales bacterium]
MAKTITVSRKEAKAITRRRLLDSALTILDEEGVGALTTTAVTKRAGIAQSSFYVHFKDVNDLLRSLIEELEAERGKQTRAARRAARRSGKAEDLRDTFRIPLRDMLAHPQLFRLMLASRHDQSSPLGEWSRELARETRARLVDDLSAIGIKVDTPRRRRRLEMISDGLISLTETLALGHLEGLYPDVEEMVEVLLIFSTGYLRLIPRPASDAGQQRPQNGRANGNRASSA